MRGMTVNYQNYPILSIYAPVPFNLLAGTYRVATEQYRNPLGRVVFPRSADSIGADVLYTPWASSTPTTIYDLKTFSTVPRPISPGRQTEFRIRFGAPAQEIFVPQYNCGVNQNDGSGALQTSR